MTNQQVFISLLTDPRLQAEIWPARKRELPEFQQLVEVLVKADTPLSLLMPMAAIALAVLGAPGITLLMAQHARVVESDVYQGMDRAIALQETLQ